MIKVPKFKMTLPYTKQEIEFRPFVVKEEKLLIMANDSSDYESALSAMGDIVSNCTFGALDIDKTPMFDVQHAFLQIRGKSIGEEIDFFLICGTCKEKRETKIRVDEFKLLTQPGHSCDITLSEGYVVKMKHPTFRHFAKLYETDDDESVYDVVAECIEEISTPEETFMNTGRNISELREFVDNLTPEQFAKMETFFDTMPVLEHTIEYQCKCGADNTITINGISNFFE